MGDSKWDPRLCVLNMCFRIAQDTKDHGLGIFELKWQVLRYDARLKLRMQCPKKP